MLLSTLVTESWAQNRTVSGKVTDDSGEGVPGANVILKGTAIGTTADIDGNYKLSVPTEGGSLVYTFVGMATQEIEIGSRSVIDVAMDPDAKQLSEVVVTALGITRDKASLGYSVQEVEGKSLDQTKEVNIVNALQGQVAGVQIQGTTGAIGGSSRITIRGSNSFSGENQPLFVVDGVPIDNRNFATSAQATGFGGGAYDYGNSASDINPADIESMSVLKGAAATAIYGSRGGNGVIVITTKKGKSGKKGIGVSVNSSVTFDNAYALIDHQKEYGGGSISATDSGFTEFTQNGVDYLAPLYGKDGAWGPKYDENVLVRHWDSWDPDADNYLETRPWIAPENDYKTFFETGVTFNNSVAISSSHESGSFRLSYTNIDQTGVIPNSELARNTVSFAATQKLSEKLSANFSGSYVHTGVSGRNATGYDNKNPLQAFTQWYQTQLDTERLKNYTRTDGTQQAWNTDGITVDENTGELLSYDPSPTFFDNPYWVRNENLQNDERNRFYGNLELSYKLTEDLTVSGKVTRDGYSSQAYEGVAIGGVDQSSYTETTRNFAEMNYQGLLSYNKTLDDLSVSATVGGNIMNQKYNQTINASSGGLVIADYWSLANSAQAATIEVDNAEKAINSVFGTASIGFKNILFLDATVRNDWSSTLTSDDRSFAYFSGTTSFVFSELVDQPWLSFGKVRVAYGSVGNDTGSYQLYDVYNPLAGNFQGVPRYTVPNTKNNEDLVNELTKEFEVGMEASFLNNRVGFDLAYYNRTTEDQIMSIATSASTGYTNRWVNAGSMRNSGIELSINATPVVAGDFQWDVSFNMAAYYNKVVELADGVETIDMGSTWAADLRIVKGQSYMGLYGQDWQRHENGGILVDDEGIPMANAEREYLGSAIADYTGGVRNTISWKGISLGALVDFQKGGVIHSSSLQWANYSGMTPETVWQDGVDIRQEGYLFDGVNADGTANETRVDAQTYFTSIWTVAKPYVYDASYIKLREMSLSYSLPNKVLKGMPISNLSIGVFGRNLAILYSDIPYLDPQAVTGTGNTQGLENAQIPSTRSMGFNISFNL